MGFKELIETMDNYLRSLALFFLIGTIPMCFHLNILTVSSVKTQLIYCQL